MKALRWIWLALTLAVLANGFRVAMYVVPIDREQGEINFSPIRHFAGRWELHHWISPC